MARTGRIAIAVGLVVAIGVGTAALLGEPREQPGSVVDIAPLMIETPAPLPSVEPTAPTPPVEAPTGPVAPPPAPAVPLDDDDDADDDDDGIPDVDDDDD